MSPADCAQHGKTIGDAITSMGSDLAFVMLVVGGLFVWLKFGPK